MKARRPIGAPPAQVRRMAHARRVAQAVRERP